MEIAAVAGLTFAIHLIATLSYSVRIVGARTGRIAVSFALFNVLVLASRMANTVQAPILAKHVETELATGVAEASTAPFRLILIAATAATIVGAFLIPSFQRFFTVHQRLGCVDAGPIERRFAQALLDGMTQVILQPAPLRFRLVADDDSVISPFPEGAAPVAETSADLFRNGAPTSRRLLGSLVGWWKSPCRLRGDVYLIAIE